MDILCGVELVPIFVEYMMQASYDSSISTVSPLPVT